MSSISEAIAIAQQSYQTGNLSQAELIWQQILQQQPDNAEALQWLGVIAHQLGKLQEAIVYYQQTLVLKPEQANIHYNLGYAFQQQGNLSTAIEHYQQAIALQPDYTDAHYNLGYAFQQQGNLSVAIKHYQQALAFNPNDAEAHGNLAYALQEQGQIEAAIVHYQQVIALRLNIPEIYYHLGNAFLEQGRHSEAIIQYQQALELEPNFPDAYVGLSYAVHQTHLEEAIGYLQQALSLDPNHAQAYHNLGIALAGQNQVNEAIDCFQKAFQLKSALIAAYWQNQLLLPILYDTQQQIPLWRQRFCRGLNTIIQQTALDTPHSRKQALTGLASIATTFYLGYQGFNDRGLQCKYGKFLHRVMAANYPQWSNPLPMPSLSKTGKIRVGYISAHFREHTAAKLTLGWLKNSDKQNFEIYSYYIGRQADLITKKCRIYSDIFYHIYGSLQAICKQIIADQLHILIFTDIGMEPRSTYIAGLRLAAIQCVTWGHPITSGLPTIDYFLSSELMEPENGQTHYCEKLVRLPNIGVYYEKPSIPQERKNRSDFHLCEEAIIYLSCQSLFKYLPQFDYVFAQIAQRVPQAQFVFLSHPAVAVTAQFQARLGRAFTQLGLNSEDYCVFLSRLERVDYLNLNLVSDIFLDTFSWSGGNTTLEAIACGLPVVTCPGELMRSRHSLGILKMMGVTQTIAHNEAEYIEIAVRLGLDTDWRQEIVRLIYDRQDWLYDDRSCVTALESFYKRILQN